MAAPPTSFVVVPDPPLQLLKDCAECGSSMQFFRVHEGTGKRGLADRGRIVQSCSTYPRCRWTPKHTPAYVYEDAEQFIQRLWVRHANPDETVYAPQLTPQGAVLRLAPSTLVAPIPTPSTSQDVPSSTNRSASSYTPCANVHCTYQNGTRTRGSKTCVEIMCTSCCESAGAAARVSGTFRSKCKAHNIEGYTPPLAPPAPTQLSQAPASSSSTSRFSPPASYTPARGRDILTSVLRPQVGSDLGDIVFAAAIQSLPLAQLESLLQCLLDEIDRKRGSNVVQQAQAGTSAENSPSSPPGPSSTPATLSAPLPSTSTVQTVPVPVSQPAPSTSSAVRSVPRSRPGGPSLRAQPLTPLWRHNRHSASAAAVEVKDAKAMLQQRKMDEAKSVTLLFWHTDGEEPLVVSKLAKTHPRLQLNDYTDLMQAFGLSEDSNVQFWDVVEAGWKMGKPSTIMSADSVSRLIVRLPPTLLYKWQDCPGLNVELERVRRQRKRRGQSLSDMPPTKVARTEATPATLSQTPLSPISHASSPRSAPPERVTTSPSTRQCVKLEPDGQTALSGRGWPRDFNVAEVARGFERMRLLMGAGDLSQSPTLAPVATNTQKKGKVTKDLAFLEVFGSKRARSTWRRIWGLWHDAPENLKAGFIAFGDTDCRGRWPAFYKAYKRNATSAKGKFPELSPLLLPSPPPSQVLVNMRDLLQTHDSVRDDDMMSELDLDGQPGRPRCDFCDEILDFEPTDVMRQMRCDLQAVTRADPTLENPQHRTATSWQITEPYCERHEFERTLLPKARRRGWPEVLDLNILCDRVLELQDYLADLIEHPHGNEYFNHAALLLGSQSGLTRLEGRKQLMLMGKTGYYGEQGHEIIHFMLLHLFRGVAIEDLRPMSFETLVGSVLLPEVSTRLIMDDLTCSQADAIRILDESSEYGSRMFPSDREQPDLSAAMRRAREMLVDIAPISPIIKEEPMDSQLERGNSVVPYNVICEDGKEMIVIE
ncbi:hypothetical protein LXA43DRAFT_1066272 [Ganoderma leucocontextum]|nr:hypothetical protein LXA43DRAFT_1066272 [Ganoderma leucocontextum]